MFLEAGMDYVPGSWTELCTWKLDCTMYLEAGLNYVPGSWTELCTWKLDWTMYLEAGLVEILMTVRYADS